MKNNWKVWQVINQATGEVVMEGRKNDCVRYWYPRWCYARQPLVMVRTTRLLMA